MEFSKLAAPTLRELFVKQLESLILSGKLPIGSQLPSERELATRMQVSRAVVNAGINEVASKGFIEIHPRVGAFVADYRRNGTFETLLSIMEYNGGRLRRDEVRSILEIKMELDKLAAKLAIQKATKEDIDLLNSRLQDLAAVQTPEESAVAAFNFYHELALISGNLLLPLFYCSFKVPIFSLWERFTKKNGLGSLAESSGQLLRMIEAKDVEGAVNSIEELIGSTIQGSKEIYEI